MQCLCIVHVGKCMIEELATGYYFFVGRGWYEKTTLNGCVWQVSIMHIAALDY